MAANSFREDENMQHTDKKKVFIRMMGYLKPHIGEIVFVLISLIICVGINLISPLFMEYAIDVHVANKNIKGLLLFAGIIVALGLV